MKKKTFNMLIREHLKNVKKGLTFKPKDRKNWTMVEKAIPQFTETVLGGQNRFSQTPKSEK